MAINAVLWLIVENADDLGPNQTLEQTQTLARNSISM